MNREKVIEWLRENTTREQWGENKTLFFVGTTVSEEIKHDWTTQQIKDQDGVYVKPSSYGDMSTEKDIYFSDVWEQPVFIDGAEYLLHFINMDGLKENTIYQKGLNSFKGVSGSNYPASGFGTKFTVELVSMGPAPEVPPQTNVNALGQYLKINSYDTQEIAGAALSRLKEQAVIVGRVFELNEVCQKYNIGSIGDPLMDVVIDYIKSHEDQKKIEKAARQLVLNSFEYQGPNYDISLMNKAFNELAGVLGVECKYDNPNPKTLFGDKITSTVDVKLEPMNEESKQWLVQQSGRADRCLSKHLAKEKQQAINDIENIHLKLLALTSRGAARNKYDREILPGVHVDVYDVLAAFITNSGAIDHAVKKLLAPGQRGVKDRVTDLKEAISSIQREIDRIGEWSDRVVGGQISKGKSYIVGENGPVTEKMYTHIDAKRFKPSREDDK